MKVLGRTAFSSSMSSMGSELTQGLGVGQRPSRIRAGDRRGSSRSASAVSRWRRRSRWCPWSASRTSPTRSCPGFHSSYFPWPVETRRCKCTNQRRENARFLAYWDRETKVFSLLKIHLVLPPTKIATSGICVSTRCRWISFVFHLIYTNKESKFCELSSGIQFVATSALTLTCHEVKHKSVLLLVLAGTVHKCTQKYSRWESS